MKRRHRTLFLVTTLVLLPVFFGLVPMNLMHKLSHGVPLSPAKPLLKHSCPFHSVPSHPETVAGELPSVPLPYRPAVSLVSATAPGDPVPAGLLPESPPLRC